MFSVGHQVNNRLIWMSPTIPEGMVAWLGVDVLFVEERKRKLPYSNKKTENSDHQYMKYAQ